MPIVASVPLQLFARAIALLRGYDVDQPRNLAKSVTVECRLGAASRQSFQTAAVSNEVTGGPHHGSLGTHPCRWSRHPHEVLEAIDPVRIELLGGPLRSLGNSRQINKED